jgi:hypothetical protein
VFDNSCVGIISDVIASIRVQVTEFPVLVAVDGLNIMYEGTEYPRDGKLLNGSQLSIPAAFQCVGPEGFK